LEKFNYIAVEGVIASGKTSLAGLLAEELNAKLLLEEPEKNPFLKHFYKNPEQYAFKTQIYFLLSRYTQQVGMMQKELFHDCLISDYLFLKDRIFASVNLNENEFSLYEKVASLLEREINLPDLVIYLQTSIKKVMENIRKRNYYYEQNIPEEYIKELMEAYNQFFFHYKESSLLIVNVSEMDFVNTREDFLNILGYVKNPFRGTKYVNPLKL